jgi:hypothetical protein
LVDRLAHCGANRREHLRREEIADMTDLAPFAGLRPLDHGLWVLSTVRGAGGVQSTVVDAGVLNHLQA